MILLFDPAPPRLQWRLVRNGVATVHTVEARGHWPENITASLAGGDELEAIGYVLHHGGDQIRNAVSLISQETLARLTPAIPLLTEHNDLTRKAIQYWTRQKPAIPHFLFCDTAFFTHLPPYVRDYAVPYTLTQQGLHRYGGFGLCHEWTWDKIRAITGGTMRQAIQVYLGNRSNLAAIRDGKPVETTIGFTHLEGVMSAAGCGDIDPTIIFQLKADGFSHSAINQMLSTRSGFAALAGRPCTLDDILAEPSDPGLAAVRRVFLYQIVKYIGAFLAALGGADTLVFIGAQPVAIMPLVREICQALDFLGLRLKATGSSAGFPWHVSAEDSALKIMVADYDPWRMMEAWIRSLINNNKEELK